MRTFRDFPSIPLRPYIDRFWGWESGEKETVALPTLLPGTGAEMVFHYRKPFRRVAENGGSCFDAAHLLCVRRQPLALADDGALGFIAVRFRAGTIHHFTQVPGQELIDRQLSATDIWGAAGTRLADAVLAADTHAERIRLLQDFLLRQLENTRADKLAALAASRLYRHCAESSIAQLASDLDIGRRQLERRFRQATGLTLVEARRLSRFQKTARVLLLDPAADCADAALAQGYYDQAHFIREFRALTSLSPVSYLKQARLKTHFYNTSRPASEKIPCTAP